MLNTISGSVENAYENARIDVQLKDTLNGFLQAIEEGLLTLTEQVNQFTRNQQDRAQAARDLANSNPVGTGSPVIVATMGATGNVTGAHLDFRAKDKQGRQLGEARLRELAGLFSSEGKPILSFPVTSGFGSRSAPNVGASTSHPALDIDLGEVGAPIEFKGSRNSVTSIKQISNSGKGGNVLEITLNTGEKIQLLHLHEFANQNIKRFLNNTMTSAVVSSPNLTQNVRSSASGRTTFRPGAIFDPSNEALVEQELRKRGYSGVQ